MADSLLSVVQSQPEPAVRPASDMLVVRRMPNPDGSSRPIFTIVRQPSSSAALANSTASSLSPLTKTIESKPVEVESESATYGESFWISDVGCDPVMDVAPGLGGADRQQQQQQQVPELVVNDTPGPVAVSSGRSSRLMRYQLPPETASHSLLLAPAAAPAGSSAASDSLALPPKMLQCSKCGKHFRNLYSLEHHICAPRRKQLSRQQLQQQEVNGVRYYLCPACSKPFKWIGNLTRHFHTHTGGRFFRCEICSKSFFTSYQVKRHMNSHLGVRYKCTVCAKPFTCKYSCTWHIRQHLLQQQQQQQQPGQQQKQQQPLIERQEPSRKLPNAMSLLNDDDNVDIDMDDLEDGDSVEQDEEQNKIASEQERLAGQLPASVLAPVAMVTVKTYCPGT